jgi:hypothetical protein
MDRAKEQGSGVYIESTPAGIKTYRRCGMPEVEPLKVLENDGGHRLTIFLMKPEMKGETSSATQH